MAKLAATPNKGRQLRQYPIATGQTFVEGALVVLVAGELQECGADPATILGFAMHDAGAEPDTDLCLVALATAESTFWVEGDNDPVAADIGVAYGVAKDADGQWYLDGTDITATRARVEDIDTEWNLYEIRFLAANRQLG